MCHKSIFGSIQNPTSAPHHGNMCDHARQGQKCHQKYKYGYGKNMQIGYGSVWTTWMIYNAPNWIIQVNYTRPYHGGGGGSPQFEYANPPPPLPSGPT